MSVVLYQPKGLYNRLRKQYYVSLGSFFFFEVHIVSDDTIVGRRDSG